MKRLKTLVFTVTFAFASLSLMAQPQNRPDRNATPEQRAEHQTTMLTKQLSLSKDQQTKVYAVVLKSVEAQAAKQKEEGAQQGQRGPAQQDPQQMKALQTELFKIFTTDQQKQYTEKQKKRQQQGGRPGGGQGGGRR